LTPLNISYHNFVISQKKRKKLTQINEMENVIQHIDFEFKAQTEKKM